MELSVTDSGLALSKWGAGESQCVRTWGNLIVTAALSRYAYLKYFGLLMIQASLWYFLIETIRTSNKLNENIICSQTDVFFLMVFEESNTNFESQVSFP